MSIDRYIFCFAIILKMLFDDVLPNSNDVGGCWWPISARAVLMDVAFWKFSNKSPNYASVANASIFVIMLHSTFTGPFSRGIYCIGVLDFCPREIYLLALLCASGDDMWYVSK